MDLSNALRVSLDSLPLDVLKQIFSNLEIGDVTSLLEKDRSFLQHNPKVKCTIDEMITNSCHIQLHHKSKASFLDDLYFLKERSAPVRSCVGTSQQFVTVHNYCAYEHIRTTFSIVYDFNHSVDIFEFKQLMKSLHPVKGFKYAVEIAFTSKCRYKVNMDQFHTTLASLKDNIESLVIDNNGESTKVMGKLNLSYFPNLKILHLKKVSFVGKLAECRKLCQFTYVPPTQSEVFDLGQLPSSLKKLELAHCLQLIWPNKEWNDCPLLESLQLEYTPSARQSKLPEGVANIVKHMTCKETTVFKFEGNDRDDGYSKDLWKVLDVAAQKKGFALESMTVELVIMSPLKTYPLTDLDIIAIANPQVLSSFKFPSTLKSLRIAWVVESDTTDLFKSLPTGLQSLNLRGSKVDWRNSDLNFAKFANLKELVLSRTNLGKYFRSLVLPESIELLKLDNNALGSIDRIHFPNKLKFLSISMNGIGKLCNPDFPSSLKELNISSNKLKELDISTNKYGDAMSTEVLYLKGNKCEINDLSWSKFPQNLKALSFEDYKTAHSIYNFGNTLEYLRMTETDLVELNTMSFGNFATIKYLYLPQCNMKELNIDIPETVVELDLSANGLREFPVQLGKLRNMRVLDMSYNSISELKIEFEYNTIEVLNLENNSIADVELRFPPTVTNLKQLDLSNNSLKELSMKSIGQTGKTLHDNLHEIVLSGNGKSLKTNIDGLIAELPKSCECLWLDTFKDSENTEIEVYNDYASNELPASLIQNKDVSTYRMIFGGNVRMGFSPEKNDMTNVKKMQPAFFTPGGAPVFVTDKNIRF
ncbi:hypothetical protein I9W82_002924 [Candida metapsilosis]|uniref:F-box domain-containing protein n=1 Tax=Candida metapsilosis TaxID=273372 RepID=A0A8H7ZC60_9ASCO|nr:hypothetical protein I9W82_002924 [Candida metapsilosis]